MSGISPAEVKPVGFIGLGLMGSAIAANLLRQRQLIVWNRTRSACAGLEASGAIVADSAQAVFERARIVFVMLSDESAIDAVLKFDGSVRLRDRTVVLMSTVTPAYSAELSQRIREAGGAYVEAPVSGSRQPAIDGTLISMISGDAASLDQVEPLIHATSSTVVRCGPVPAALTMKLAVNTFLITLVTGLAESFHFAEENGVDAETLRLVLDSGPMASAVSRSKGAKITHEDWAPHAAIPDVLKNSRLVRGQARRTGNASPLIDVCTELYAESEALGHAGHDMAAVISALRNRTETSRGLTKAD
ncbi:NAD(P)-dependent oxidoreductase [Leucobacter sp. CSA1]|uniref:NAD(P)-dependent oxidoreductase n=1 Tax=Leucobacter chromiisoli TaxID=2796471 RepID=A0A934Q8N7_9MICO|nr:MULTISPECIES: NAD(P)-dependent oxidoreductase [Microbacteriaceae]MBK0420269.1 NAD(P)-dependent oxidoreductase [Leucobacter chromiisoli]MCD1572353.1 NAD(P)-dependent oxidoreductase [Agromyces mediolanus]